MKSRRDSTFSAWSFVLVAFVFLGTISAALAAASNPQASSSPSPDVELICHTNNLAECYPKVFQATDQFQKVHDDQDLPSGLHVRLNVWTGEKEAKINVPDEIDPSLEGLPTDQSVVLVDPEPAAEEQAAPPKYPPGAPAYDPVGKVKPPTDESAVFHNALKVIRKGPFRPHYLGSADENGTTFDDALEGIQELSHDLYYGLKLAEDAEAFAALLCAMSYDSPSMHETQDDTVDASVGAERAASRSHKAATVVAAALQNNPNALKAVEKAWDSTKLAMCRKGEGQNLKAVLFSSLVDDESSTPDVGLLKAKLAAITGLLKSNMFKDEFLASSGMDQILRVLVIKDTETSKYDVVRRRAANLVMDNFLDESMGATLGKWPNQPEQAVTRGEKGSVPVRDAYFDHHIRSLAHANRKDDGHWSVELWKMIQTQREAGARNPKARIHEEL